MTRLIRSISATGFAVILITSCGSSSDGASKEDVAACSAFEETWSKGTPALTDFSNSQAELEGTRAGFDAAIAAGKELAAISDAATAASSGASKKGKELFDAVATTFGEAGLGIGLRGGSMGPNEVALLEAALASSVALEEFCGGF